MGISYSTSKYLAPIAYLYNFAAQQYGMLSTPNMKAIHDANLSYFSPQPWFIAGFFASQQLFQLAWLYRLWRLNPQKSSQEKQELDTIVDYVPYFALGNVCIGTWMFFWNSENLKAADVFVVINTLSQLYYMVARLQKMNTKSTSSILTHVVSKTFAGIGVLDILHNTSVAFAVDKPATSTVKLLTGLGFGLGSAMSDWIFGGCLVYDLVAMSVGQSTYAAGTNWSTLLALYAAGSAVIVGAKNFLKPPYEKRDGGYEVVEEGLADGEQR